MTTEYKKLADELREWGGNVPKLKQPKLIDIPAAPYAWSRTEHAIELANIHLGKIHESILDTCDIGEWSFKYRMPEVEADEVQPLLIKHLGELGYTITDIAIDSFTISWREDDEKTI